MKSKLFLLFLITISFKNNAQQYVHNDVRNAIFNYQTLATDEHKFNFQITILDYYVPTFSSTIETVDNTLEVKMFYNITEQIFNFGNPNIYTNVVDYNQALPTNITHIKMSTNVIMHEDNPPFNVINVDQLYFRVFDLSNLSLNTNYLSSTVISPNPTTGQFAITATKKLDEISIYNIFGKQLLSIIPNEATTNIELTNYAVGVYFVKLTSENQEVIKKVVLK